MIIMPKYDLKAVVICIFISGVELWLIRKVYKENKRLLPENYV